METITTKNVGIQALKLSTEKAIAAALDNVPQKALAAAIADYVICAGRTHGTKSLTAYERLIAQCTKETKAHGLSDFFKQYDADNKRFTPEVLTACLDGEINKQRAAKAAATKAANAGKEKAPVLSKAQKMLAAYQALSADDKSEFDGLLTLAAIEAVATELMAA